MNTIEQNKMPATHLDNTFDTLGQGFDGGYFYGLEYILDDFFQKTTAKPRVAEPDAVDWFGLNT